MTNPTDRVEIITSVQRRRRWTASEKVRMVEETFERARAPAPLMISAPSRPICSVRYAPNAGAALVLPFCNTKAMQLHLDEINQE